MSDFLILAESAAFKLTFAAVSVALMFLTLRLFGRSQQVNFRSDLLPIIQQDPKAVAIYRGLLALAVAHLLAGALG